MIGGLIQGLIFACKDANNNQIAQYLFPCILNFYN